MLLKQSDFCLHFVIWCSPCCESWVWHPSRAPKTLGIKRCCQGRQMNAFFCNFVGDDLGIVKQMSFWRIGDWTWQTFCYMPITDSISQLIDGVSIVFGDFGRLCLCGLTVHHASMSDAKFRLCVVQGVFLRLKILNSIAYLVSLFSVLHADSENGTQHRPWPLTFFAK